LTWRPGWWFSRRWRGVGRGLTTKTGGARLPIAGSCRPAALRSSAGAASAALATPGDDAAEPVGADRLMLDIAPAIDLAEHRSAERVGRAQPVAQRLHRTKAG